MAKNHAHRLGSFLGNLVQDCWNPILKRVSDSHHGLYFDYQHSRPARPGKKVTWTDESGNKYDLDFVIERGGSETRIGVPVGFVEIGYRRYTKHSREKVRGMWGQIQPVTKARAPKGAFQGAVLFGDFSEDLLSELRSKGVVVLHYDFRTLVDAFAVVGIDIYWNERTSRSELKRLADKCQSMSALTRDKVMKALRRSNKAARDHFLSQMRSSLTKLAGRRGR